jgi:hypothetical protein
MSGFDPVTLEVVRNATASIADEMGVVLRRTAYSTNIKAELTYRVQSSLQAASWSRRRSTSRCIWG